jgi:ABC-type sugar transport system substrate-binding protein
MKLKKILILALVAVFCFTAWMVFPEEKVGFGCNLKVGGTPQGGMWEVAKATKLKKRYLIGIMTRSLYMDYFLCLQKSAQLRCADWGVLSVTADAMLDPQLQLDQIDRFITMGVDAIILNPQDSRAIIPGIQKLNAKGIPVITLDVESEGGKVDLHIAFDNTLAGEVCGKGTVELLKKKYGKPKGVVLEAMGDLRHSVTHDRTKGFHNIVDQYPDIKVINKTTDWTSDSTFQVVQSLLTAYGDTVDALYMHADCQAPGGVEAIKSAKLERPMGDPKRILVITMNGDPGGMKLFRDKRIDFLALQPVQYYGFFGVDYAIKILEGQKVPAVGTKLEDSAEMAWSPAFIKASPFKTGPQLLLNAPIIPDEIPGGDPRIWGNWLY